MYLELYKNVYYSVVDKISNLILQGYSFYMIINYLPLEEYGLINSVAGCLVIFFFFNISISSILLRDHNEINRAKYKSLVIFNLFKIPIYIFFSIIIFFFLEYNYNKFNVLLLIIIYFIFIFIRTTLIEIHLTKLVCDFKQKKITYINLICNLINIILVSGIIFFPSVKYIFFKESIFTIFYLLIWYIILRREKLLEELNLNINIQYVINSIKSYSLWTHLNGAITNFIYRSDIFFLSLFFDLETIGFYAIALNLSFYLNIFLQIITEKTTVFFSNIKTNFNKNLLLLLLMINLIISFLVYIIFININDFIFDNLIKNINNYMIKEIFLYLLISILIIRTILGTFQSYFNIFSDIKLVFS